MGAGTGAGAREGEGARGPSDMTVAVGDEEVRLMELQRRQQELAELEDSFLDEYGTLNLNGSVEPNGSIDRSLTGLFRGLASTSFGMHPMPGAAAAATGTRTASGSAMASTDEGPPSVTGSVSESGVGTSPVKVVPPSSIETQLRSSLRESYVGPAAAAIDAAEDSLRASRGVGRRSPARRSPGRVGGGADASVSVSVSASGSGLGSGGGMAGRLLRPGHMMGLSGTLGLGR